MQLQLCIGKMHCIGQVQQKSRHNRRIDASEGKMQKTQESVGSRVVKGIIEGMISYKTQVLYLYSLSKSNQLEQFLRIANTKACVSLIVRSYTKVSILTIAIRSLASILSIVHQRYSLISQQMLELYQYSYSILSLRSKDYILVARNQLSLIIDQVQLSLI